MKNKTLILFATLLFVSCVKDPLSSIEDDFNIIQNNDIVFLNSPNYNGINSKSGNTWESKFTPNKIYDAKDLYSISLLPPSDPQIQLRGNNYRYLDYNNDGKVDLFGFMNRYTSMYSSGYTNGKLVLYSDIHGDKKLVSEYETERTYQGWIETNDFDGDGMAEFIVFGNEDHSDGHGNPIRTRIPLSYIDISTNGVISHKYIGNATSSHDITSADIDNDGDVDIINFPWFMARFSGDPIIKSVPIFYINDGNGNFELSYNNIKMEDIFHKDRQSYIRTAVDAYDLNNDGNIDLIFGNGFHKDNGYQTRCYDYHSNYCGDYEIPTDGIINIVWGDGTGKFDIKNSIYLDYDLDGHVSKTSLGFNFLDVNNDGLDDIIMIGVQDNYEYGYIDVYFNLGSNKFSKVKKMDKWVIRDEGRKTNVGIIPTIYTLQVVDMDNDGDFDLRPSFQFEPSWYADYKTKNHTSTIMGQGTYWENNGSSFTRKESIFKD